MPVASKPSDRRAERPPDEPLTCMDFASLARGARVPIMKSSPPSEYETNRAGLSIALGDKTDQVTSWSQDLNRSLEQAAIRQGRPGPIICSGQEGICGA